MEFDSRAKPACGLIPRYPSCGEPYATSQRSDPCKSANDRFQLSIFVKFSFDVAPLVSARVEFPKLQAIIVEKSEQRGSKQF